MSCSCATKQPYTSGKNQLAYVDDGVLSGNYGTDIDDQAAANYTYDKIGNLVSDASEDIDTIVWNVYEKIERVVRTSASTKSDLEFHGACPDEGGNAMGNRVCKIVKPRSGSGIEDQDQWVYTYYLRDASGNVIAVYDRDYSTPGATYTDELSLKEDHLYGSSRVGVRGIDEIVSTTTYTYSSTNANGTLVGTAPSVISITASTTNFNHEMRRKSYELSNHLGNVLVTVSDARTATNSSGTVVAFNAVVVSAQDYYAFGSAMVGRTASSASYRYSFNGKEKENEIAEGDLDFGMRIYDSRLGRWLTRDPYKQFQYSPYVGFANNPIGVIDIDGGWIPGVDEYGRIYVQAEEGDDPTSLMKFFGTSNNARRFLPGNYFTRAFNDHTTVVAGQRVYFNSTNVYSMAMADAYKHPDKYKGLGTTYNCHTAAINGSTGVSIVDGGNMTDSERNETIEDGYESVKPEQAIFGTTLVTYGWAHTAVFFGRSKDGTAYVFTKNGMYNDVPKIMSAPDLTNGGPMGQREILYGGVRDVDDESNNQANSYNRPVDKSGHVLNKDGSVSSSGYYNPTGLKLAGGARGTGPQVPKESEGDPSVDEPSE